MSVHVILLRHRTMLQTQMTRWILSQASTDKICGLPNFQEEVCFYLQPFVFFDDDDDTIKD